MAAVTDITRLTCTTSRPQAVLWTLQGHLEVYDHLYNICRGSYFQLWHNTQKLKKYWYFVPRNAE
jgi:hypothetical protein